MLTKLGLRGTGIPLSLEPRLPATCRLHLSDTMTCDLTKTSRERKIQAVKVGWKIVAPRVEACGTGRREETRFF